MPFAFDHLRAAVSLQYASGSHWAFGVRLLFLDLIVDFAASIPILSSHADRTLTDIIVILRLRSSAVRLI
jgi:hypothetical protein